MTHTRALYDKTSPSRRSPAQVSFRSETSFLKPRNGRAGQPQQHRSRRTPGTTRPGGRPRVLCGSSRRGARVCPIPPRRLSAGGGAPQSRQGRHPPLSRVASLARKASFAADAAAAAASAARVRAISRVGSQLHPTQRGDPFFACNSALKKNSELKSAVPHFFARSPSLRPVPESPPSAAPSLAAPPRLLSNSRVGRRRRPCKVPLLPR